MSANADYTYKIVMIGDSGVGKSCLVRTFTSNSYEPVPRPTVAVDFHTKLLSIGTLTVKLDIWDTAGQERYHSVPNMYYRGAMGAMVLFDVTRRKSYNNASKWAKLAKDNCVPGAYVMLVAAKTDDVKKRNVPSKESSMFARENNFLYCEVSAKDDCNVHECFFNLALSMSQKFNTSEYSTTLNSIDINNINRGFIMGANIEHVEAKTKVNFAAKSGSGCC